MMKILLPVLLIVYAVQCAEEEDCPANACEVKKYKCLSQDSCDGELVPRAAACGCCPGCKPYLKEGDECAVSEPGSNSTTAKPPAASATGLVDINSVKSVCRPGNLTCLYGVCVSIY